MGMQFLDLPTISPYNPHQPSSRQTKRKVREFQSFCRSLQFANHLQPFFGWGLQQVISSDLAKKNSCRCDLCNFPRNVTKLYGSWEDNQSIFLAHLGSAVATDWVDKSRIWNAIHTWSDRGRGVPKWAIANDVIVETKEHMSVSAVAVLLLWTMKLWPATGDDTLDQDGPFDRKNTSPQKIGVTYMKCVANLWP